MGPEERDPCALGLLGPPAPAFFDPKSERSSQAATSLREPWALKTTDTLRPGERGTKALVARYGERLVCVRYRCDPANRKRYKTVELIEAEADWNPPPGPDDLVHVRVAYAEEELRQKVKAAGGRWQPQTRTWELPLKVVDELEIRDRVVEEIGSQM